MLRTRSPENVGTGEQLILNLKRGFRRLLLVLSVVWVGGSGVYLWQQRPQPHYLSTDPNAGEPIPVEYDAEGRPVYDAEGKPVTSSKWRVSEESTHVVYEGKHYVLPGKLSADEARLRVKNIPTPLPTRQQIEALLVGLTTVQQHQVLDLLEAAYGETTRAAPAPHTDRSWLPSWLKIGFTPPVIAFALLESLLWAVRGFLGDRTP